MPRYQFYLIGDDDRITGRYDIFYRNDDFATVAAAVEFPGRPLEVWLGARCVMTYATGSGGPAVGGGKR